MTRLSKFTAILDACVLYPAPVRDILLSLAAEGLFKPKWTEQIQDEWVGNLLQRRKDLTREILSRTVRIMNDAFPDANVEDFEKIIPALTLPDEEDRHVLASGIRSNAHFIITFNLKDFPESELQKYDIEVQSPDTLISDLIDINKNICCIAFSKMVGRLKFPPKTKEEVAETLVKCGLKISGDKLKNCF